MAKSLGNTVQWLLVLLVVTATVAFKVFEPTKESGFLADIPLSGFGFDGEKLEFTQDELNYLGGAEAIKHEYSQRGYELVVIVVDGTNNRHSVHDPVFCFRGAGFEVMQQQVFPLYNGQGRLISLGRDDERRNVAFWFSNGDARYTSFMRYLLESTAHRLTFGMLGSQPRMVTVHSVGRQIANWSTALDRFPVLMDI